MSIGHIASGSGTASLAPARTASETSIASLNGQIRQDKQQLDDWTTCVSAKTTKGQVQIQRLSGEIDAAQERVNRLALAQRSIDVWA